MRVTAQILQHGLRSAQQLLGINYPIVGVEALLEILPGRRIEKIGQMPLPAQIVETSDELAANDFGKRPNRKPKTLLRTDPFPVIRQAHHLPLGHAHGHAARDTVSNYAAPARKPVRRRSDRCLSDIDSIEVAFIGRMVFDDNAV